MTTQPAWHVAAPWDVRLPTTAPLIPGDLREHGALLPGINPHAPLPLLRVGTTSRCALAYLIPQSTGATGRLVLCWAFKAPLVALREITAALPVDQAGDASLRHRGHPWQADRDAVVSAAPVIELELTELFTQILHLPDGEHALVRIDPAKVAVAPIDTPIHAYSPALDAFPGN